MGAVGWVSLGQAPVLGNVRLKLKLLPYDEGAQEEWGRRSRQWEQVGASPEQQADLRSRSTAAQTPWEKMP